MNRNKAESQLLRASVYRAQCKNHNVFARQLKRGDIIKVAPGVYTPASTWESLYPESQHGLRVQAQSKRLTSPTFALHSAAAVLEFALIGPWPNVVHIIEARDSKGGSRKAGHVVRHRGPLSDDEIVHTDGIATTSVPRTAYDLACALPFIEAVAMLDHVRRRALASYEELSDAFANGRKLPGRRRALKALEFSTNLSDSVQESRSRVLIHQLGFPPPQLQHRLTCDGRDYFGDFWWPEYEHWGEFDGVGKYLSSEYQNGRTSDQIVISEKRREDAIRRTVAAFSRWDKRDLDDPQRLFRILRAAGLPSEGTRLLPE